jgi:thiosulfate dehydrogenase
MSRAVWFIVGLVIALIVIAPLGIYLFAKLGGLSMATTAKPLPLEATVAHAALRANVAGAAKTSDPLTLDDANLLAGARVYRNNCAVCHGLPDHQKTAIAAGEFPPPPQLFEPHDMVTDDPEGVTHWKVLNGIRLSGMPGFDKTLSDAERWQVTMLVAHADKLPPGVKKALTEGGIEANLSAAK